MQLTLNVKLLLLIGGVFSISFILITGIDYRNIRRDIIDSRYKEAQNIQGVLMSTRRIYQQQFINSGLPLNNETIGFLPAHAMSRISREFSNWASTGVSFNNVSDRPRNPGNEADPIELKAMAYFRDHPEASENMVPYTDGEGRAYLHFSTPIYIEKYCLKCHGNKDAAPATISDRYDSSFNYREGDLRGIMSIKLPVDEITDLVIIRALENGLFHLGTFLITFFTIIWLIRRTVLDKLNRLLRATERVARGDYEIQMVSDGNDEFNQLLSAFEKMAHAIELREEELAVTAQDLRVRNNELMLLYKVTDLLDSTESEAADTMQVIVNLMHSVLREHDITAVSIDYDEHRFVSKDFLETGRAMTAPINVSGQEVGCISFYNPQDVKKIPTTKTTVGTESLANKIAKEIGSFLQRRAAESDVHKLLQAVEQSPASIVITDTKGNIEYVNATFERVTGYTRGEAIGCNPRVLKSGEMPLEIYQQLWRTIKSDQEWRGELHNKRKNGELYWESVRISPVKESDGSVSHFLAIKEDVTIQKLTEEKLRHSQKMDAVGQLTGGIAHDFNNLLSIMLGNLDFLKQLVMNNKEALKRVNNVDKAALRAADLTRQLLGFSRKKSHDRASANLNRLIRDIDSFIVRSVTPEVVVEKHLADDLWLTEIDPGDFQDALLNLILNARDAMPDGGRLSLETSNMVLDATYAELNPGVSPGDYVLLAVSDTGSGVPDDIVDHIFEPFYTTKALGKGTGLGLSMVFGCMKRSNGFVRVYSEQGLGATIRLFFPRLNDVAEIEEVSADQEADLRGGEETILIVDDEQGLVDLAQTYLHGLGYQTIAANSGNEAIEQLLKNQKVDLIFSDVVMPGGINGYELAAKVSMEYPEIKVLLSSGFMGDYKAGSDQSLLRSNMLKKPYSRTELANRLREILDGDPK